MSGLKLWADRSKTNVSPIAVIDIGSNSIRLVIYEGPFRAPLAIYNEKILCGLGRELDVTNNLHADGVARALQALPRFAEILRTMKVSKVTILATAAVREADNGAKFVEDIQKITGFEIKVISGKEEARLSGLGVLSGIPDADGVMGDIGGGSLELVELTQQLEGRYETLPLGPVRMSDRLQDSTADLEKFIDDKLRQVDWLEDLEGKNFYVVGGAWRAIAKIYMEESRYPLRILHRFEMGRDITEEFCKRIYSLSDEELRERYSDSTKRLDTIRYAALLLQHVIKIGQPKKLVFSANGIREGCLFDQLPPKIQAEDPLISACKRMPWALNFNRVDSKKLYRWINPIFEQGDRPWERRLREAACMLSEIGRLEHPDYRVDHALERVMRFPIVGVTHKERVFLALSVASRYGNKIGDARATNAIKRLMMARDADRAKAVGAAMRLAYALTGGVSKKLGYYHLTLENNMLLLSGPADKHFMAGEIVKKRLKNLANILALQYEIDFSD